MTSALITLSAVLAVCAAWQLYMRHRRNALMAAVDDPAARPPETAVPVDSPLVHRLYAARDWNETRMLLSEDFVMVLPDGRRVGADSLTPSAPAPATTVEAIYADLERPSVLYVRDVADLHQSWTRVVVASCGTKIRELGPTSR